MAANEFELNSFLTKFKHLCTAGYEASLQLNCNNRLATVSLNVTLGSLQVSANNGSLSEMKPVKLKRKRSPGY